VTARAFRPRRPIPPPGPHGGDGPRLAAALGSDPAGVLDLSLSLNPFAPDVGEVVGKHLDASGRYPDPTDATTAMAAALGVAGDRVLLTNGGSEAIALVGAEMGGSVTEPDFSLYPRGGGPRWRSNPHNPSGRLADEHERADVWDEAFYPLATGRWSGGEGVIVGSLTKVFACPGLRLGYVMAPDRGLIERLRRRQPAWSVNGIALAALPSLLDRADLPGWAEAVAGARSELAAVLRHAGLEPQPSDGPWLLVRAPGLRTALARRAVLVRDCTSFGLPDHVRIAVPAPRELPRFARALAAALA
jgi:histidinol-phosphate/aromatic aminotransferase/cobyric acid decarboxylase-like protein